MAENRDSQLLGFWMTFSLVVGGMIGAGIFLLPVSLAPLGANAVFGWLISGVGALALAYALARLSRQDGLGIQAYIERELGATVGFSVTWAFLISVWAGIAALAIATASALARIAPALNDPSRIAWTAIGLIVFLTMVNAMGARASGRLAVLTVSIKILPLLAVVFILGQRSTSAQPFEALSTIPISFDAIATGAALTLFALTGFETATAPVGKVRDPARTIFRAIMLGTSFVALLYLLSSTAVTLILPASQIPSSTSPYADAIGSAWGEGAALFAAFAIAVSAFGCLNGAVLIAGELGYSLALRGDLPRAMATTRRGNTPVVAQVSASLIAILLVMANMSRDTAGLFTFVILLSTSATLWLYLGGAIAALNQRPPIGAMLVIVAGIIFTAFAFYGSGAEANLWSLALLATGLAVRAVMRRLNSASATPRAVAPAAPPGSSA
jgi:APA family basic amino acid/polyamine antiporter